MTCRPHDGEPSPLNRPARFRGTALQHEKSVQAQHVQALIDLRLGQPRIKRNRDAGAARGRIERTGGYRLSSAGAAVTADATIT
jgi:hypothetical protein